MIVRTLACTLAWGCVVTPSTTPEPLKDSTAPIPDTAGPDDTAAPIDPTTATPNACPADVTRLPFVRCGETTAPLGYTMAGGTGSSFLWNEFAGAGVVTEIGGALAPIPDSVPFYGFGACGPEHVHQVRLLDEAGEVWTFGWDAAWTEDDVVSLAPGDAVTYEVVLTWGWVSGISFLLADTAGPVVLFDLDGQLSVAPWGMSFGVDIQDVCTTDGGQGGEAEHFRMTVGWPGGAADLRSGQRTTVPLAGRTLEVTVPHSYAETDCLDSCGSVQWTAWETED